MRKYLGLIIIIIIASILRLWHLNTLPYGTANDEVSYMYSAYTIWHTGGYDLAGKFLPLSINLDSSLSPVPVYLTAPFVGLFGLLPFTGRLPFALISIGAVVVLYFLADLLFSNKKIAFLAGSVMAISPWHIFSSRGAWDADMTIFFFLLGIFLFLKYIPSWRILWSIPAFLLGFYSYHATKIFFLTIVPILCLIYWKILWKKKKQFFSFIFLSCIIILSFGIVTLTQGVSRQGALMWNDPKSVADTVTLVKYYREKNTAPYIFREIISNKLTISLQKIMNNYLEAFSPQFLFINGDINPIYSYGIFLKGVLYLPDAIFLILGLFFLKNKAEKKSACVTILSLLVAPLGSAIGSGTTFITRGVLMIPFLCIIIGSGIYYAVYLVRNKKILRRVISAVIFFVYIICLSYFVYQYIFSFNTYGKEFWNASSREAATLIATNKEKYQHIYIANTDDKFLFQFLFYNSVDPHLAQQVWQKERSIRTIGTVVFFPNCLQNAQADPLKFLPAKSLYLVHGSCYKTLPTKQIVDSNEPLQVIWHIYEKN